MKNQMFSEILAGVDGEPFSFEPFFVTVNGPVYPVETEIVPGNGTWQINVKYPWESIRDTFYFTRTETGVSCRRIFETSKELSLCELGVKMKGFSFGGDPSDDYFYHVENPRIYERMTFPVDYDRVHSGDAKDSEFDSTAGNRWADPGVVCERIGRSPYQPFPAILLSNYKSRRGLVHGTLSQKLFFHNYIAGHEEGLLKLEIYSGFKAVSALRCPAGKRMVDEWYLGVTEEADDLDRIFAGYTAVLRKKLPPMYGATDINRNILVWGSWNDGLFRDISEDLILKEARYLKENFPLVKWIQVDDGYAVNAITMSHGLGMPYEGDSGVDYRKFPNGLRGYADKLKELGMRPAVWIGGFCPNNTPIYKEKPEWFADYSYRVSTTGLLDVSKAEVRDYMSSALDTFFYEYGFEGMKHDFWSYAFEDSHALYSNETVSGYEMRDWWCRELRKHIPGDGYMQSCCDIAMGNPFLGEYFTNYRYGIDIGSGNWDCVKTNFMWGMACFATHTGDLFVPNSDSVGLFPGLNDTEAMFCLNYCLVTHSAVEIAGKLSEAGDSPRLKTLKKAVCNPNNGQDVYLGAYDYRDDRNPTAQIMYFKTPHFSPVEGNELQPLRTVGLFNVQDEPVTVRFSAETIALPSGKYLLTNVWTGENYAMEKEISFEVPAHGSILLAVSKTEKVFVLDANMRLNSVSDSTVEFDYKGDAELLLRSGPKAVKWNGRELSFRTEEKSQAFLVTFQVPGAGIAEFEF